MDYTIYFVSIPVILAVAIIGWILLRRWRKSRDEIIKPIIELVPPGEQFFPRLTNGDPPGTIFRITPQKVRFHVGETKNVQIQLSTEAQGRKTQRIEAKTDVLAKILDLNLDVGLIGSQNEELVFEMDDSVRETTADIDIDPLVKKTLERITVREEDRYFVIRETSATKQISFELKREQVDRFGGEAKIQEKIEAKATIFSKKDATTFELKRKFDELMRVMFVAEEIHVEKPKRARYRGPVSPSPKFLRGPVKESLDWTDEQ